MTTETAAPRIEREFFRSTAAYRLALACADDFGGGEWSEHVAWRCGYDVPRELAARGCPAEDIEADTETLHGLA